MTADDLPRFLLARYAEREAEAHRAQEAADGLAGSGQLWVVTGADNAVGVDYDPARALAECAAVRAIVELHTGGHECSIAGDCCRYIHEFETCDTLRLLAAPDAGHSDFRPEWTPRPRADR